MRKPTFDETTPVFPSFMAADRDWVMQACWRIGIVTLLWATLTNGSGCRSLGVDFGTADAAPPLENPLFLGVADRDLLWRQLIDSLDDHFKIESEERVRVADGVLIEGRITTYPVIGATLFEPWRGDSTPGFERWHSTLQTIRRRAAVRVIPASGGYLIDLQVFKELEDVVHPEHASLAKTNLRHNSTLERNRVAAPNSVATLGWIPLGRDVSLEQRILSDLQSRFTHQGP